MKHSSHFFQLCTQTTLCDHKVAKRVINYNHGKWTLQLMASQTLRDWERDVSAEKHTHKHDTVNQRCTNF